jgi:hypothetical protein
MPRSKSHYDLVLKFWRSVETFAIPDMPETKKLGPGKDMYRLVDRFCKLQLILFAIAGQEALYKPFSVEEFVKCKSG